MKSSAEITLTTREWLGGSHSFVREHSSDGGLMPPVIKTRDSPSLQSVTKATQILQAL